MPPSTEPPATVEPPLIPPLIPRELKPDLPPGSAPKPAKPPHAPATAQASDSTQSVSDQNSTSDQPSAQSASANPSLPVTPKPPLPPPFAGFGSRASRLLQNGSMENRTDSAFPTQLYPERSADYVSRATAFGVITPAETFLDGVGGIPSGVSSELQNSAIPPGARIFRVGPVTLRGALNESLVISHNGGQGGGSPMGGGGGGSRSGDHAYTSSGLSLDAIIGEPATGHFLTLSYGMGYTYPSNQSAGSGGNKVDQELSVEGRLDLPKLKLGMSISFASLSGMNRDVGGAVDRDLLDLSLNASYPLGAKTSLDSSVSLPIRQVSGGIGSSGFSTANFINYQLSQKTTVGIGLSGGMEQDNGTVEFPNATSHQSGRQTQTFARLLSDLSLNPTPLIAVGGEFGAEFRNDDGGNSVNPIFNIHAGWAIRPRTSITVSAQETIQSSAAMAGQNYSSTAIQVGVAEQLGNRISVSTSFQYEYASYQAAGLDLSANRKDNLFSVQVGMSWALSPQWSATLAYVFANNSSSIEEFSFTSDEVLLSTSISF